MVAFDTRNTFELRLAPNGGTASLRPILGTGPQGPEGPAGPAGAPGGSDASFAAWVTDEGSATHDALADAFVDRAAGLSTPAPALPHAVPSGDITWAATTLNFRPRSVGCDGNLYFTYLNKLVVRSADPTLAARTGGPDFTSKPVPNVVLYATRTTAGYVVITTDITTDVSNIWFCPNSAGFSANLADWTMVQATKAMTTISIAKPRVINGVTWLVAGEYKSVTPSAARKLWLSTDGGQTWTSIRDSVVNSTGTNSHWHNPLIMANGRIWASQGDTVNAWFGYTDDKGKSWVPSPYPTGSPLAEGGLTYQQPTQLVDLGETIVGTPDSGNTLVAGVWAIDPDSGATTIRAELASGERTFAQYGSGTAQRGKECYICFPDQGSGSKKTYILGTGDYGRTWHLVSTIDWGATGQLLDAIIGPDLNGRIYVQPGAAVPTYGGNIMVGTLPSWTWQT